ncbi:hypothetical protein [Algoriphagus sp. NG3]|uniref:hypothetical protein n=1 Tax=Algoriphagus sp. NG3 TaxID=3097546 RepID=UPI002A81F717|nr:hypothetical protein [Algoriphagus sp. NG3]WPR74077.1 hypothetical protein SLW71_15505 [Algoriphagus sp. NG3]
MGNTFSTLKKEYTCTFPEKAHQVIKELFGSIAPLPFWLSHVTMIQNAVFDTSPDYKILFPDCIFYQAQLFLKLIYANHQLRDFPPISASSLSWDQIIESRDKEFSIEPASDRCIFNLIDYAPKQLSHDETLDPSLVIRKFFKRRKLKEWVKRWNSFREMATFSFSVVDGDELEFLKDFTYFLKLAEASYLIHARYSSI